MRRVLGVIREEAEEDRGGETSGYSDAGTDSRPETPQASATKDVDLPGPAPRNELFSLPVQDVTKDSTRREDIGAQHPASLTSHASQSVTNVTPAMTSMFSLLSHPKLKAGSPGATPGSQSPGGHPPLSSQALSNLNAAKDLKAEVIEGIQEVLDELNQADDQIAGYALDHIHSSENVLTYSSSITVQKFLIKAAAKRKFTVLHAEAFPNNHDTTHAIVTGKTASGPNDEPGPESFTKTLTAAGITVILIPDSAVFALMSRVNKVVLGTESVFSDGSLVAAAGSKAIAKAARMHSTHVVVLCAVYQLSPVYPFNPDIFMEAGDPSKIVNYNDGRFMDYVEIGNPLFDYVPAELIDLYITNM